MRPLTPNVNVNMWSCREQFESGMLHFVSRIRDRRYLAVDEERGLVVGFAFFDHDAGASRHFKTPDGRQMTAGPVEPWTWEIAELFKVEKGLLHEIEAVLERAPYGMGANARLRSPSHVTMRFTRALRPDGHAVRRSPGRTVPDTICPA